jgi:hypothetical protein
MSYAHHQSTRFGLSSSSSPSSMPSYYLSATGYPKGKDASRPEAILLGPLEARWNKPWPTTSTKMQQQMATESQDSQHAVQTYRFHGTSQEGASYTTKKWGMWGPTPSRQPWTNESGQQQTFAGHGKATFTPSTIPVTGILTIMKNYDPTNIHSHI